MISAGMLQAAAEVSLEAFFGASLGLVVALAATPLLAGDKQTKYLILHDFKRKLDAHGGSGGLVGDENARHLYGMSPFGGANNRGAIFKVSLDGSETVLYSFSEDGRSDGRNPSSSLLRDAGGNLYGTTLDAGPRGFGTVFKFSPNGKFKVLHAFAGGSDGSGPLGGLVQDDNGNLYGATDDGGGEAACDGKTCGTIFKITPSGTESVVFAFSGSDQGYAPHSKLLRDKEGNLFGTTEYGGSGYANCYDGCGVIFEVTPDGQERVLHAFAGENDGAHPSGGLIEDDNGILYGTAYSAGTAAMGVVFKITTEGTYTVLHDFTGGNDGAHPLGGVIQDLAGNLYGTTYDGGGCGGNGCGVVYRIATDTTLTVLHDFKADKIDGIYPTGSLLADDKFKRVCGATAEGGTHRVGTVFRLNVSPNNRY